MFRKYRGNTVLHRLNPLTKLFILLSLNISAVLFLDPVIETVLFGITLTLFLVGRVWEKEEFGKYHIGPLFAFFAVNIAVLNGIFGNVNQIGEHVLFVIPVGSARYPVTVEGFLLGYAAGMRFLVLALSLVTIAATTYPRDLANALEKLGFPPAISNMFTLSLRFIPQLEEEFRKVLDARRMRGDARWDEGGVLDKIRMLKDCFPTVLANALVMVDRIGCVLESRMFGVGRRTIYREYLFKREDYAFLLAFSVLLLVSLYLRFVLGVGRVEFGFRIF